MFIDCLAELPPNPSPFPPCVQHLEPKTCLVYLLMQQKKKNKKKPPTNSFQHQVIRLTSFS